MNNVELDASLWEFAIHGRNPEIIQLLEENVIINDDKLYNLFLESSINCHHNEITDYIYDNLLPNVYSNNKCLYGFAHHNYSYIPNDENDLNIFFACQYDYPNIVEILTKEKKLNINKRVIYQIIFK